MGRREASGAQVVRVGTARSGTPRRADSARRPAAHGWLRRDVSFAGLLVGLLAIGGVVYLGLAAKGHAVAQAKQAEQAHYSRAAVQYTERAPAPGQPALDEEYPDDEQPARGK